jgi:hypothetical protein
MRGRHRDDAPLTAGDGDEDDDVDAELVNP